MDYKEIIEKTKEYVKTSSNNDSAHDFFHSERVLKISRNISEIEKPDDLLVVELAALLHDVYDWKFCGNLDLARENMKIFLRKLSLNEEKISKITYIIDNISFKGGKGPKMELLEGQIVQDADRIDALGAIGIARAFAYGGHKNREIYNPEIKPSTFNSAEEYKKSQSTTINHFYEKLFLLKEKMNTITGKKLAEERSRFMEEFVKKFKEEWECN